MKTYKINHQEVDDHDIEIESRRSTQAGIEKYFCPYFLTGTLKDESQSYKEAISSKDGPLWKEAIQSEIDSIQQKHTWKLMDLSSKTKLLSLK